VIVIYFCFCHHQIDNERIQSLIVVSSGDEWDGTSAVLHAMSEENSKFLAGRSEQIVNPTNDYSSEADEIDATNFSSGIGQADDLVLSDVNPQQQRYNSVIYAAPQNISIGQVDENKAELHQQKTNSKTDEIDTTKYSSGMSQADDTRFEVDQQRNNSAISSSSIEQTTNARYEVALHHQQLQSNSASDETDTTLRSNGAEPVQGDAGFEVGLYQQQSYSEINVMQNNSSVVLVDYIAPLTEVDLQNSLAYCKVNEQSDNVYDSTKL